MISKRLYLVCAIISAVTADHKTLIPRRALLGNADHQWVRINGDGRWLAYLAPYDNVVNVYVRRLADGIDYPVTRVKHRGVDSYSWLEDNQTIVFRVDQDGDENWAFRSFNLQTGLERTLTKSSKVKAKLFASSPLVPDEVVVGTNERDTRYFDAYRLNVRTGSMVLMFRNDLYSTLFFDMQLRLRMAGNETDNGTSQYFLLEQENASVSYKAKLYRIVDVDVSLISYPLNFHQNGKVLYWYSNEGRDKMALVAEHLETGESRVLHESLKGDFTNLVVNRLTGEPMLVYEKYAIPVAHCATSQIRADYEHIKKLFPEDYVVSVLSTSLDSSKWIVTAYSGSHPFSYYVCDVNRGTDPSCQFQFHMQNELFNYTMSPMKAVEVTTRDNLTEVCFLTFPHDSVENKTGFPRHPLPTVVYVHGGPWSQDTYGFDGTVQLLANRGYAVIQCNYRGSTGYGRQMLVAGNGEWGRKMQYDLLDAVEWAVERNYTLRDKVAIFGASYGGYAVLAGLTFTPDAFACGIDEVGPSNLVTLTKSIPDDWKPDYGSWTHRLGASPDSEEGRRFLESRSPVFFAHRIRKPLLIAHGSNDPRVKQNESDQIVAVLETHQIPFTYLLFLNEGHGFSVAENRLAFWTFVEPFLQQCLGGYVEPVGSDRKGANFKLRLLLPNGTVVHDESH